MSDTAGHQAGNHERPPISTRALPDEFAKLDPLVPVKFAARMTSFSERHLRRMVGAGTFVKPVRISPGRIAFRLSAINAWIADRERDQREVA